MIRQQKSAEASNPSGKTAASEAAEERDAYMKKTVVPACITLVLSLVISIGSFTFLSPCVHDDGTVGACWWAGKTLLGLGCLLAALSMLTFLSGRVRPGTYLSSIAVCILGILTPGTLISLCRMSSMRCRAVMQPAMMILFAVAGLFSLAGVFLCIKEEPKGKV